ncbi:MAG: PH domain-containing protein [Patescibacteria group bacterium]
MNIKDKMKMLGLKEDGEEKKIFVSHVTIRQSISFLIFRLIALEIISGVLIVFFYSILVPTGIVENIFGSSYGVYNTLLFITFVIAKTLFMIYMVILWLNEYYEITPKEVIHRTGLIFRKEERHVLAHIDSVEIEQGLLGRIFNYGNLILFNWVLEKNTMIYLIHNPKKYLRILQDLLPESDQKKSIIREHIVEKERV